jgi:predicted amidohydrolase YtcJ
LNHFTVLPRDATLDKMARHNILIAQQPNFTYTLEGRYAAHLVGERLQTNNALRTPMSRGIFVALGSDILPIGPMVGIYASVTRRGMSGAVYGSGERLSMPETLVGYTHNGAYLTFEEGVKGTLEPGRLADLVVLSEDLLNLDPEKILDVQVDLTVVGGKVVYERQGARRD